MDSITATIVSLHIMQANLGNTGNQIDGQLPYSLEPHRSLDLSRSSSLESVSHRSTKDREADPLSFVDLMLRR